MLTGPSQDKRLEKVIAMFIFLDNQETDFSKRRYHDNLPTPRLPVPQTLPCHGRQNHVAGFPSPAQLFPSCCRPTFCATDFRVPFRSLIDLSNFCVWISATERRRLKARQSVSPTILEIESKNLMDIISLLIITMDPACTCN